MKETGPSCEWPEVIPGPTFEDRIDGGSLGDAFAQRATIHKGLRHSAATSGGERFAHF
jgi:hypothetical protein